MPLVLPAFLQQKSRSSSAAAPPPARPAKVHRRVRVRVEQDGLLLFAPSATVGARIGWGTGDTVERVEGWSPDPTGDEVECEADGLLGVLRLFQHSWVLALSRSSVVASLPSTEPHQVRAVTDVLAIPLDPARAAHIVREHAAKAAQAGSDFSETDVSEADEGPLRNMAAASAQPVGAIPPETKKADKRERAFGLGAFFWRPSPSRQQRFSPLVSVDDPPETQSAVKEGSIIAENTPGQAIASLNDIAKIADVPRTSLAIPSAAMDAAPSPDLLARAKTDEASRLRLDAKIIREVVRELRHGYYCAYDADITRSLQYKTSRPRRAGADVLAEPDIEVPLHQRADPRFVWNRYISRPVVKAGLHDYVLPIMQGFVKQTSATLIPEEGGSPLTIVLTLISRRAIERPGLRYQRRGLNAEGQVANNVESEFIVEVERPEGTAADRQVSSFVQTRGSIPLFWSQSPWALKPVPVLERSGAENAAAIGKHFETQTKLYGKNVIINLAEADGKEGVVVNAYREAVEKLGRDDLKYVGFDFHKECRGMRFENVSHLIDRIQPDMDSIDFLWATPTQVFTKQNGVTRVNCIDCLDRTNVAQSAIARKQLATFLMREGIATTVTEKLDVVFNELWASNGDAISLEYAGTSALKGDFVRTGKRNWRGALNDATNSLARMWQNTIADFFKQSMLDYVLGVNLRAFEEYQEKVNTTDPGEILRLATIRTTAIETAASNVLADGETLVRGWTLLSSVDTGERTAHAYEEKVLLLSTKAVYSCSYEYSLQKVRNFIRVPVGDIVGIVHGEYILSTLSSFARDPVENYGFAIRFLPSSSSGRAAAYSLRNKPSTHSLTASSSSHASSSPSDAEQPVEMAFKAMRRDLLQGHADEATHSTDGPTGEAATKAIVDALLRACIDAGAAEGDGADGFVEREAIMSLEDAQRATGILARLRHRIEHLIWL